MEAPTRPTFYEAFKFWLKLGFIGFGGPAGQIAIMREFLVEKKRWISDSRFFHALNYCYLLPGPEAQQLATYIGWLLHGIRGGIAAGTLFVIPSMFILLGLSILYVLYGQVPIIYAIFDGLKPAVVAIILVALIKIARKSLTRSFHYLMAIASFAAIFFFKVLFPYIIIASFIVGVAVYYLFPKLIGSGQKEIAKTDEQKYLINSENFSAGKPFSALGIAGHIFVFIILWFLPQALLLALNGNYAFWWDMSLFFTKSAFVTFGGAYAVLPYVAQVSVEKFGWLSSSQMIDGFALGETTPGPLIMILAFVGFMGGYNIFNGSIMSGTLGLLLTTYYTFLPSFLFIFAGAPIIEKTKDIKLIRSSLNAVTAAVVGVILNLTVYFGIAVIFPKALALSLIDYSSLVWIAISILALQRFKIDMLIWILISAAFGIVHHYLLSLLASQF